MKGRMLKSAWKMQSWEWKFSRDGGAVGVYLTGLNIPKGATIYPNLIMIEDVIPPTPIFFSFGFASNPTVIYDSNFFQNGSIFDPAHDPQRKGTGEPVIFTLNTEIFNGAFVMHLVYLEAYTN